MNESSQGIKRKRTENGTEKTLESSSFETNSPIKFSIDIYLRGKEIDSLFREYHYLSESYPIWMETVKTLEPKIDDLQRRYASASMEEAMSDSNWAHRAYMSAWENLKSVKNPLNDAQDQLKKYQERIEPLTLLMQTAWMDVLESELRTQLPLTLHCIIRFYLI